MVSDMLCTRINVIILKISSICARPSIWSLLPKKLGIEDALHNKSCYWKFAQNDFGHRSVDYISLEFPDLQAKKKGPWGIAWTMRRTAEGFTHGFISMLLSGWVPYDPSELFRLFLIELQDQWKARCADANDRIEVLVRAFIFH